MTGSQHRLARMKPGTGIDIGTADPETADAVVALTSIFRRTGFKYRDRAYRYAVADTGHLLENLRLAGHFAALGRSAD